jgi:hypothetical protein
MVKGESRFDALSHIPPKSKVPFFPIDAILAYFDGIVPKLLQARDKDTIVGHCALLLSFVWCTRPATLMSVMTDRI